MNQREKIGLIFCIAGILYLVISILIFISEIFSERLVSGQVWTPFGNIDVALLTFFLGLIPGVILLIIGFIILRKSEDGLWGDKEPPKGLIP